MPKIANRSLSVPARGCRGCDGTRARARGRARGRGRASKSESERARESARVRQQVPLGCRALVMGPYTLHPTPYTLHATRYTLRPQFSQDAVRGIATLSHRMFPLMCFRKSHAPQNRRLNFRLVIVNNKVMILWGS